MPTAAATGELSAWHAEAVRALNRRDYRRAHELCLRILTVKPDFADALFLLAMLAAEHGTYAKALELIDRVVAAEPARAEYHAQRGRCLIALHRPREAFEAAERALALDPDDALTLDTIGVVMTRAGAHADAVQPFERAVARAPAKTAYQYNLGAALQFVGDFAGAQAAYRRAIAADRSAYRAWSSLAQVARAPLTAEDVVELEAKLAAGTLDETGELHVCHALAKHNEDLGRYADAFAYLERGKRRKRAALAYEFSADRQLFAAAAATSPAGDARATGYPSAEPIFIVGMPRTGTTLVERILSSHPHVYSAGELTNFALAVKQATGTSSNRVLDSQTLAAGVHMDPHAVGRTYVDSTRPRTGRTPHFIDKMPLNFFFAALIRRALPNAKIICVRRNPLDTCLSNYRQLFATTFSYYNYAYALADTARYFIEFDALARHFNATLTANYIEVRYEDVVEHTEREARRLVAFCGLEWDPACLAFEANAAPVATASSVQVRQPIYRTALERWRKYERELAPARALLETAGLLPG